MNDEDKVLLSNFDAWAFYVDKQYMGEPVYDGESDSGAPPNPSYVADRYPQVEVLLFRKAHTSDWKEIDRKNWKTEKEQLNSSWQSEHEKKIVAPR